MQIAITPHRFVFSFHRLALLAICHASVVLLLWVGVFNADLQLISERSWLILAWLWLAWPLLLALHPARSLRRVSVPLIIGTVLLIPCAPTMFALTVWAIGGFEL